MRDFGLERAELLCEADWTLYYFVLLSAHPNAIVSESACPTYILKLHNAATSNRHRLLNKQNTVLLAKESGQYFVHNDRTIQTFHRHLILVHCPLCKHGKTWLISVIFSGRLHRTVGSFSGALGPGKLLTVDHPFGQTDRERVTPWNRANLILKTFN